MLTAHRVPPQMMEIMPNNIGTLVMPQRLRGRLLKLEPLQKCVKAFNHRFNEDVITYKPYLLENDY